MVIIVGSHLNTTLEIPTEGSLSIEQIHSQYPATKIFQSRVCRRRVLQFNILNNKY